MTDNAKREDLEPVRYMELGSSEEDKRLYSDYFQRSFYWMFGAGADGSFAHRNYFVSDYDNNLNYIKCNPYVKKIWLKIAEKLDIDVKTQVGRCYLLGQTAQMDGPWHQDNTEDDDCRTIVYYPVKEVHRRHRGTQFRFDDGAEEEAPYQQDWFVDFNADIYHRGLSTTSKDDLRVALVFQCYHLSKVQDFIFQNTCGNDERLDGLIGPIIPR